MELAEEKLTVDGASAGLIDIEGIEESDSQKDKYLTFNIATEEYAIAISHVTEIIGMLNITEVPQTPTFIKGVINLRGKVIQVMDVRLRFSMESRDYDERTCVIVVNFNNNTVGLVVDTVSEVLDIPAANIEISSHLANAKGNSFICGMGKVDEKLTMILDVNSLLISNNEMTENFNGEE